MTTRLFNFTVVHVTFLLLAITPPVFGAGPRVLPPSQLPDHISPGPLKELDGYSSLQPAKLLAERSQHAECLLWLVVETPGGIEFVRHQYSPTLAGRFTEYRSKPDQENLAAVNWLLATTKR